jgi:hypothetical protein
LVFSAKGWHAENRLTWINAPAFRRRLCCAMAENDDASACRRKIALYREYLANGVDGGWAMVYLSEIAKLELLLERIEAAAGKSVEPPDVQCARESNRSR